MRLKVFHRGRQVKIIDGKAEIVQDEIDSTYQRVVNTK
jgi:hypothetical protein